LREFSLLLYPAKDLLGQWIAHCLNWDLVSQGSSPSDATRMLAEAIVIAIEEDGAAGLDPDERKPAPSELWQRFQRVMFEGLRISPADVDKLKESRDHVVASVMYLAEQREPTPRWVPPPVMTAQLWGDSHAANG
jgi:hypothetical protein